MIEHGILTASGFIIVGPGWACEADVVASVRGHAGKTHAAQHGVLVARTGPDGAWCPVRAAPK